MSEVYTKNILNIVVDELQGNEELTRLVPSDNIWKKSIPEGSLEKAPLIRVCMIDWRPYDYSSDKQTSYYCELQIDAWQDENNDDVFEIGQTIQKVMKEMNFQQSTYINEYDPDTTLDRDGRRYVGIIYI